MVWTPENSEVIYSYVEEQPFDFIKEPPVQKKILRSNDGEYMITTDNQGMIVSEEKAMSHYYHSKNAEFEGKEMAKLFGRETTRRWINKHLPISDLEQFKVTDNDRFILKEKDLFIDKIDVTGSHLKFQSENSEGKVLLVKDGQQVERDWENLILLSKQSSNKNEVLKVVLKDIKFRDFGNQSTIDIILDAIDSKESVALTKVFQEFNRISKESHNREEREYFQFYANRIFQISNKSILHIKPSNDKNMNTDTFKVFSGQQEYVASVKLMPSINVFIYLTISKHERSMLSTGIEHYNPIAGTKGYENQRLANASDIRSINKYHPDKLTELDKEIRENLGKSFIEELGTTPKDVRIFLTNYKTDMGEHLEIRVGTDKHQILEQIKKIDSSYREITIEDISGTALKDYSLKQANEWLMTNTKMNDSLLEILQKVKSLGHNSNLEQKKSWTFDYQENGDPLSISITALSLEDAKIEFDLMTQGDNLITDLKITETKKPNRSHVIDR